MLPNRRLDFEGARAWLQAGQCCLHPTEAVFGVGVLPSSLEALRTLRRLKRRPPEQALLLVGSEREHFLPYLDLSQLPEDWEQKLRRSKAKYPLTWVMPAVSTLSSLLIGSQKSVAMRWTAFQPLADLCRALRSALVSTSANPKGAKPAQSLSEAWAWLRTQADAFPELKFWEAPLGLASNPSLIFDIHSHACLRGHPLQVRIEKRA